MHKFLPFHGSLNPQFVPCDHPSMEVQKLGLTYLQYTVYILIPRYITCYIWFPLLALGQPLGFNGHRSCLNDHRQVDHAKVFHVASGSVDNE